MLTCHWTNLRPTDQFLLLLSFTQIVSLNWMTPFRRSTVPWLWGWRGHPVTSFSSGQRAASSAMMALMNSRPLSDYKIAGAPIVTNKSRRFSVTSSALFAGSGRNTRNLLKWFTNVMIFLKFPSDNVWKLTRSIWHLEWIWWLHTCFTTRPFGTFPDFIVMAVLREWNVDVARFFCDIWPYPFHFSDCFLPPPWQIASWAGFTIPNSSFRDAKILIHLHWDHFSWESVG